MAEKDLYDEFETITNQLNDISKKVSLLKEELSKTLEENEEVKLENQNLRSHLEKVSTEDEDPNGNKLSDSRLNLENLYLKGFHICRPLYGARRDRNKEECVFCLQILDSDNDSNKKKKKIN